MSDYLHDLLWFAPYFVAVLGTGFWLGWVFRGRRR